MFRLFVSYGVFVFLTLSVNVCVVASAIKATTQTIKTGKGFLSSAISGARIVIPLAKI